MRPRNAKAYPEGSGGYSGGREVPGSEDNLPTDMEVIDDADVSGESLSSVESVDLPESTLSGDGGAVSEEGVFGGVMARAQGDDSGGGGIGLGGLGPCSRRLP